MACSMWLGGGDDPPQASSITIVIVIIMVMIMMISTISIGILVIVIIMAIIRIVYINDGSSALLEAMVVQIRFWMFEAEPYKNET